MKVALSLLVVLVGSPAAQDAYSSLPLSSIDGYDAIDDGTPGFLDWEFTRRAALGLQFLPQVALHGAGEAYFALDEDEERLVVRTPVARDVTGLVLSPTSTYQRILELPFRIESGAADPAHEPAFWRARAEHYRQRLWNGFPGGAWFRHELRESRRAVGEEDLDGPREEWGRISLEAADTLALFSGGRALAENLQLDRSLPSSAWTGASVPVDSLTGITVAEMDFAALLGDREPALDALSALVPADQHALFFPSLAAMGRAADEAERLGALALDVFEPRSLDALTRERYERQLAVRLGDAARRLGGVLVREVAMTGSDPYLRTGGDVALLLGTEQPAALAAVVGALQRTAWAGEPARLPVEEGVLLDTAGEGELASWRRFRTPDRRLDSILSIVGDAVVVTNSLAQLERIARAARGELPALATSAEYAFFRGEYPAIEGELLFLVVPDAAIRRWCGPRWRIATSRRTRAQAALAELTATHLDELVLADIEPRALASDLGGPPLSTLTLDTGGVHSSTYGRLDFLTPVSELELVFVTGEEAELYERWRDGYERAWSGFFDPIGARLVAAGDALEIDLSVVPVLAGSDYRGLMEIVGDATLPPGAGDPRADAILRVATAVDTGSAEFREFAVEFEDQLDAPGSDPLGWMSGWLSAHFDADPFWQQLREEPRMLLELGLQDPAAVPLVVEVGSEDTAEGARFLELLRAAAEAEMRSEVAWNLCVREDGQEHVEVDLGPVFGQTGVVLHLASAPGAVIASLNRDAFHRALDRTVAAAGEDLAVAGENSPALEVELRAEGLEPLGLWSMGGPGDLERMQAWSNLPVLDEWHRRYPERDPVALHEQVFGERLVEPGGGKYVFDAELGAMSSSVHGHPARPLEAELSGSVLAGFQRARFGLCFAHDGVQVRAVLSR